ncbi:MAG: glycoside hydrolase family 5 protein [Bacteroidales bacterium]|nr:glycoside hydrolase family 5 protein [Bacteroidales bacterium]
MKRLIFLGVALAAMLTACGSQEQSQAQADGSSAFVRIDGTNLITPQGDTLFILGTNLGNWLNPEGYMFGFRRVNSPHFIDEMLCQLVGPTEARKFWKAFKDNYITRADIDYIASTGANTIRLPFHYKLFTDEDYMGLTSGDGFERVDSVVEWCRANGLYLILDMHDAPGGQTGDNIDDSYGYPWLLTDEASQQQFCDIWRSIADHYKDEPTILAYELINEPIAPYFAEMDSLNSLLEPLHKRAVKAIREVDNNHIVMLGGAQWNGNFTPFTDWTYDDKIMYTCHRYGGDPTADAIRGIIDFRDKTGLPMYMGEIGHNTDEWQAAFCQTMRDNNIGYTFWPYKKAFGSCFTSVEPGEDWRLVVDFAESPRSDYRQIREARPDQATALKALNGFIEASRFANTHPQEGYIRSLGLNP